MKYNSLTKLYIVGLVLLTLSSCLKDLEDHYGAFSTTPPVAELPENPNAATGTVIRALPITGSAVEMLVRVNIAVANPLDRDITVTIDTSKANLVAFNNAVTPARTHQMLPDSLFSLPSKTIVIPKGTIENDFVIMINTHKFDPSKTYVLPIQITDAQGLVISGNYGKQFIQIGAKNKYDGIYTVTANHPMLDVVSATLTGNYPFTYHLITTGAHTVECFDPNNGVGYRHRIFSGTSLSIYGFFGVVLHFNTDGSGQIVDATNHPTFIGNPSNTLNRNTVLDPTGANTWNPTTKEVNVKYIMRQGTTPRTYFSEKFTYVGPRP